MHSQAALLSLLGLGFELFVYPALAQAPSPAPSAGEAQRTTPSADQPGTPESGTPSQAKPEAPPLLANPAQEAKTPEWVSHLTIGGGVILYYYQPAKSELKNNLDVFFANLVLDGHWGVFGLHFEPRFRDSKLRPFFDGPAWLQEAYASVGVGPVTVKLGKSYKQLGLFWDNSFYGNVQVYDGLKLDPNYGVSVEATLGQREGVNLWAQYFVIDGHTNVSLAGRDTLSIAGARRRDTFVGRAEPFLVFGENSSLHVGLSAEHFTADLPGGKEGVTRLAADAKFTLGGLGVWGEVLHQSGKHVDGFPIAANEAVTPPIPGQASGDNTYFLAGAELGYDRFVLRYNLSTANYSDVSVKEIMHVPGLQVNASDNLSLLAEYVIWRRQTPAGDSDVDRSLNITLNGHF